MKYTIKSGDTLSKIAKASGIDLTALLDANPAFKANPEHINIGDVLEIPHQGTSPVDDDPSHVLASAGESLQSGDHVLGKLSAQYETGGRGPGTVSTGKGDAGGVSYGSYQMTSAGGGTVGRFVGQADFPWRNEFANLTPGSAEFTAAWKKIAASEPERFHAVQHEYIKRTHFDPLVAKVKASDNLDLSTRAWAVQDVVWSTAVQHGPNNNVIHNALNTLKQNGGLDTGDPGFYERLIRAIYAERGRKKADGNLMHFSKNSKAVQDGVANRFVSEQKDALQMLKDEKG